MNIWSSKIGNGNRIAIEKSMASTKGGFEDGQRRKKSVDLSFELKFTTPSCLAVWTSELDRKKELFTPQLEN
jgi:hypothetical protein